MAYTANCAHLAPQARVGVSLVLLLFCRLANVMVPLTFKHAIDLLTEVQACVC